MGDQERYEKVHFLSNICINTPCDDCPMLMSCTSTAFGDMTDDELNKAIKQCDTEHRADTLKEQVHKFIDNSLTIKVKYFEKDLTHLAKISQGNWIDLRSAETVDIKAGEYKLIRLGVGMILPEGYEAIVAPRSSTPSKFGVLMANSIGVIDNSYSGDADEWKFPAYAIRDAHIEKGDRICQFRIIKNMPSVSIEEVEHFNADSRGGIGSTGTK